MVTYGRVAVAEQLAMMATGLQSSIDVKALIANVADQMVASGIDVKNPYIAQAENTVTTAGIAMAVEGNNENAKLLAAQLIGTEVGLGIENGISNAEAKQTQKQYQEAAQEGSSQESAPGVPSSVLASPDLTKNQLTNYYNQNQDQYMTGGGDDPSSGSGINATSQSSLNAGASAPRSSIGSSRNSMWNETKSFGAGMLQGGQATVDSTARQFIIIPTTSSEPQNGWSISYPHPIAGAEAFYDAYESGNSNTRAFMLGEVAGGITLGAAVGGGVGFEGDIGLFGGGAVDVGGASTMRQSILSNIAESQSSRVNSNFPILPAKETQLSVGYNPDAWSMTLLPKGSVVYGGLPGQSAFYTDGETVSALGNDSATLFQGLQVPPDVDLGYRPQMGRYVVQNDMRVPVGIAQANPLLGVGGGTQYFVSNFESSLELTNVIELGDSYDYTMPTNRFRH